MVSLFSCKIALVTCVHIFMISYCIFINFVFVYFFLSLYFFILILFIHYFYITWLLIFFLIIDSFGRLYIPYPDCFCTLSAQGIMLIGLFYFHIRLYFFIKGMSVKEMLKYLNKSSRRIMTFVI